MKPSEASAEVGYNKWHSIEDLPLTQLEKEAVLEWFARKLWVIVEESRPEGSDYYCKSYDPLVIEGNVAHSYVFLDSGRHHEFEDLEELEKMLMQDVIETLRYRNPDYHK